MSLKLRPYQSKLVSEIRQAYSDGYRAPLVCLSTGGGKTTIFAYVTSNAAAKGRCVFLLAHRAELVKQIADTLARFGCAHAIVAPGPIIRQCQVEQFKAYGKSFVDPGAKVLVCSAQTLVRRMDSIRNKPDLIVIDECFPAGTIVDGVPIESLNEGDMVRSVNHLSGSIEQKRITRLFKSRPATLCTVNFSDGTKINCTAGHPFFVVNHGYFNAKNLKAGMPIFKLQTVRNSGRDFDSLSEEQAEKYRSGLLWKGVLWEVQSRNIVDHNGGDKQEICLGSDDCEKSDEEGFCSFKNAGDAYNHGPQAESPWRKWNGDDSSSDDSYGSIGTKIHRDEGIRGFDDGRACVRVSDPLQDRFSDTISDDCDRGGRDESFGIVTTGSGQEERPVSSIVRVDSVEIHEQDGDGGFGGLLPDGYVYNIEVEGNHNYFANDVLVHNCHHLVAGNTWGNIIANYPHAKLLPVTATPIRVDGKGLGKNHGGFADTMVSGPSMRELIEGGFLSPYRIFAPPTALDMSGVKTRAGDYAKDDLANAVDKPVITGSAVEHYLKLASGKRAVAFCVSVEHAMHVAAQFRENGIPAEHLDGTMDAMERDRKIKAFSAGEILVLTSADLISEGVDIPAIEVAILLRPTQSLSLYLQQVGRALRTFPGKSEAIILDHVNSTMRHGLIDEEREWSLEGKKKSAKKQSDDEDDVKVKCCPECFAVHEPAPACPVCSHVYEIKAKKLEVVDGSLSEITKSQMEAMRKSRMIQQGKAQSVEALVAQGMSRFRAEKIIEARLAKQSLQQEIFDKLDRIMVKTGFGPYATCGFTRSDVLRMKPKQLKELSATITTVNYKELQ